MIFHADGNSFYASCEQIFRPDLRGKPVAVLSNNDGIIIALNKEAKALGIKRGDPYFKVRDLCNMRHITIFSSNYTLYADISRRITSIYMEYAPAIEEYSIDEAFLFFDKCNFSLLRSGIHAHDFSDLFRDRAASDGTSVHRCLACGDRLRHRVAAGIAARAAVVTRKAVPDLSHSRIGVHMKLPPDRDERDADHDADDGENDRRNDNS